MANATDPICDGFQYQALAFWLEATQLLNPSSHVEEVLYEAEAPQGFDDIVVKFNKPCPRSDRAMTIKECNQIKWSAKASTSIGYKSLVTPKDFGGSKYSLLERLRDAVNADPDPKVHFILRSVRPFTPGDPLAALVNNKDGAFELNKLFDPKDATMRTVRECWRDKLGVDEAALAAIVKRFYIRPLPQMHELRRQVNLAALAVGLRSYPESTSDFRYGALIDAWRGHGRKTFSRADFRALCAQEDLLNSVGILLGDALTIALRTTPRTAAALTATAENTLDLTAWFEGRNLKPDYSWEKVRQETTAFVAAALKQSPHLRLILDAYLSVAAAAGAVCHPKSGARLTELVQHGIQRGPELWRFDGDSTAPAFITTIEEKDGDAGEVVILVSATQGVEAKARAYCQKHLPQATRFLSVRPVGGPAQDSVRDGGHAAQIAQTIANAVPCDARRHHLFFAGPNALMFSLARHIENFAPCTVYEYDMDGSKEYNPGVTLLAPLQQ